MDAFDGTIAVWGDDNATDEIDGAEPFSEIKLQLVNSNVLYDIILPEITYANNDILLFESADYQIVDCGNDMGCTDSLAMNFDPLVSLMTTLVFILFMDVWILFHLISIL